MFILTVHLYKYCHGSACNVSQLLPQMPSYTLLPCHVCYQVILVWYGMPYEEHSSNAVHFKLLNSVLSRWLYKNSCVLISNGKYSSVELWQMQYSSVWWFKRGFSLCLITGRTTEWLWSTVLPGLSWNIPHFWKTATILWYTTQSINIEIYF